MPFKALHLADPRWWDTPHPAESLRFVRWYTLINAEHAYKHTDPNISFENKPARRISQPVNKQHMEPTARSIARTYSDRVYPDPWEKVEDYQRVQAYAAEHPKAGRTAVGTALELPAERIRLWLKGGKPDPVRGIETASANGWLDPEPDSDMASALVELLAHVLAGGSINETFVPAITVGRRTDRETIEAAFAAVGVNAYCRHVDSDGRATELYPATDASVLGRCLVAMGAPHGSKTALDAVPAVVWECPERIRRRFL